MAKKVLVIDDEPKIVEICQDYLIKAGFEVLHAYDGLTGLAVAQRNQPDLVVLDLMLPGMDGLDVCRELRRESNVPIIMLTARVEETDKLIGLELGADDYITKPFSPREVVARVKAVLRRVHGSIQPPQVIRAGDVAIDMETYEVTVAGEQVVLTPIEFKLLTALVRHPGQVFTRLQLLEHLQDTAYIGYERIIDQHIKNLRAKLGDDGRNPRYIVTLYGVGYKFVAQGKQDA